VNVEQARHDGAWGQVLRWAGAADERNPDLWRSGRADAREEALRRLGRWAEANGARAAAREAEARSRPARAVRARFGHALELTGLDLPAMARPGDPVTVRFAWRLAEDASRDYAVRIRLVGSRRGGELAWEHEIGASHGTTRWAPGERVHEAVTFAVPGDVPAGTYAVRVGVRERPAGPTLRVGGTDLPAGRRSVVAGTLTIGPALTAAPAPPAPLPHP
jgi:hypothetical protein